MLHLLAVVLVIFVTSATSFASDSNDFLSGYKNKSSIHNDTVFTIENYLKNNDLTDREKADLLNIATRYNAKKIVSYLLSKGFDPAMPDSNGISAIEISIAYHKNEILFLYCGWGFDPNVKTIIYHDLFSLATSFNNEDAALILVKYGYDLDHKILSSKVGDSIQLFYYPIGLAAIENWLRVVDLLLKLGDNIEKKSSFEMSPLLFAIHKENIEMVKLLLERGANVSDGYDNTTNPLKSAKDTGNQLLFDLISKKITN